MSQKRKIVYVARDIERALGMAPGPGYIVIANRTAYAETVKEQYPEYVHLIDPSARGADSEDMMDTVGLLTNPETAKIISDAGADVLVFKNTSRAEAIAKDNGWTLLNPSAALAEKVENKISQTEWLGELGARYLPPHEVKTAKEIAWDKQPIIIQWAHGHTGDGTILVNSAGELAAIQQKFPDREARVTPYMTGPSFTANVAVGAEDIAIGNISYQITGMPPFTDSPFATVGNDWSLTHSLLHEAELSYIETMAKEIAEKLRGDGWRGLFGIDAIRDDERNRIFLIEINARQPASASYESALQAVNRAQGVAGETIFEAHLRTLCGDTGASAVIPINDGAQIIQRVTGTVESIPDDVRGSLELAGYESISYPNTKKNEDLLRIQSAKGIMETHGKFNARGKEIIEILEGSL